MRNQSVMSNTAPVRRLTSDEVMAVAGGGSGWAQVAGSVNSTLIAATNSLSPANLAGMALGAGLGHAIKQMMQ